VGANPIPELPFPIPPLRNSHFLPGFSADLFSVQCLQPLR
jgi:hypothetical protein